MLADIFNPALRCFVVAILLVGCDSRFSEVSNKLSEVPAPKIEKIDVEPDQLSLPTDDCDEPWNVGMSPSVGPTRSIQLGKILPKKYQIWGGAISERSGKAILTYMDQTDRDCRDTFAIVCDVNRGRALARWKVDDFLAPFSISADGTAAIFCRQDGVRSARETLYLATKREGSNIPDMEIWRPLVDPWVDQIKPYQAEWEIIWAAFAGDDRIVTLNNAGKLHIWDSYDLSRIGMFPGVQGIPALTPDGSKVAFLTEDMVALLDPSVPEITRVHRVGDLPGRPVLSFEPDGHWLAIAGTGQATLLELDTLKQSRAMIDQLSTSQSMSLMPDLAWAGGSFLYKSRQLYSFDSPIPVWRITGTRWEMPFGRALWAVVSGENNFKSKERELVFRAFELPTDSISKKLEEIFQTTDVIALRVGDPVSVDVSGLPLDRQDEIRDVLVRRLEEEGYRPSRTAKITLCASLDQIHPVDVTYHRMWDMKEKWTYNYEIQRARLEFVNGDRRLWSTTAYEIPPGSIRIDKLPTTGFVSNWGGPDYQMFSEHRLPAFLRGDRSGSVLGSTYLSASGAK